MATDTPGADDMTNTMDTERLLAFALRQVARTAGATQAGWKLVADDVLHHQADPEEPQKVLWMVQQLVQAGSEEYQQQYQEVLPVLEAFLAGTPVQPQVGMGATLYYFTDRYAATVIWVSPSGHQVKVQENSWKRLDHNGMSESQLYDFCRNDAGIIHPCTRRADGHYRVKGRSAHVEFGYRSMYHDFSF